MLNINNGSNESLLASDLGDFPTNDESAPLVSSDSYEDCQKVSELKKEPPKDHLCHLQHNNYHTQQHYDQHFANGSTTSSRTRVGSFFGSVTHTISTSIRKLRKSVGFLQTFTLIVGILVGSGVFISPALVMQNTHDSGVSFILWFLCGLIALGGSLCYVELGCAIKRAGGNYAYIHEAYGDLPAFLCCWTIAFIVDPAGVAAICLTLGTYVMKPFEEYIENNSVWYPKMIAAVIILMVAFVNCWSVRAATRAQTLFTFAQISSVIFVVSIGIWQLSKNGTSHITQGMFNTTDHLTFKDIGPLGKQVYTTKFTNMDILCPPYIDFSFTLALYMSVY